MNRLASVILAVLCVPFLAIAGENGISPTDGNYKFVRTSPPPETSVAAGDFGTSGSGSKTCHVNPEVGDSSDWTKDPVDGNYYRDGGTGVRSFCIHADPEGGYTYQEKMNGSVTSSGRLEA